MKNALTKIQQKHIEKIERGATVKYDRYFMFGKVDKNTTAKIVGRMGHTLLLDDGYELSIYTEKFRII
tara:strand:+ start:2175 stop:2378 length:204 start_codon:yes stop_codon:yes gene_type:complete